MIILLLTVLVTTAGAIPCPKTPPVWPDAYIVQGVLTVPSAELEIPFHAWYEGKAGNSRIDLYDGTSTTYLMADYPKGNGSVTLIAPVTTENYVNNKTCFRTLGNGNVGPNSVLPDMYGYKCIGHGIINGIQAQKWTATLDMDDTHNLFTTWIQWKKMPGSKELKPVPVFFETKGSQRYYQTFFDYHPKSPDKTIWETATKMTCPVSVGMQEQKTNGPIHELHTDLSWDFFLNANNRKYENSSEYESRKDIFKKNHHLVHSHNSGGHSYRLALNHLADRTDEELRTLRGKIRSSEITVGTTPFPYHGQALEDAAQTLPDEFDWRIYGAVTPVKNQYNCGNCWSFSTTGTIEGAYFLKTGKPIRLSEQVLVDCSWGYGNGGCNGGWEKSAYQWIMKHGGLPLEDDYPFLSIDGRCHYNETKLHAKITGYIAVPQFNETALKVAIFKSGPVSVNIDAAPRTFSLYASGVYDDPACLSGAEDLDHAVLAIGFGVVNGQSYWLIKNSWSDWWGDEGFILISTKNNTCGVLTDGSYVTI